MKYNIPTLMAFSQVTDIVCNWTSNARDCKLLIPRPQSREEREEERVPIPVMLPPVIMPPFTMYSHRVGSSHSHGGHGIVPCRDCSCVLYLFVELAQRLIIHLLAQPMNSHMSGWCMHPILGFCIHPDWGPCIISTQLGVFSDAVLLDSPTSWTRNHD